MQSIYLAAGTEADKVSGLLYLLVAFQMSRSCSVLYVLEILGHAPVDMYMQVELVVTARITMNSVDPHPISPS